MVEGQRQMPFNCNLKAHHTPSSQSHLQHQTSQQTPPHMLQRGTGLRPLTRPRDVFLTLQTLHWPLSQPCHDPSPDSWEQEAILPDFIYLYIFRDTDDACFPFDWSQPGKHWSFPRENLGFHVEKTITTCAVPIGICHAHYYSQSLPSKHIHFWGD